MFLPSNITLKFGDSGDFVAELQRRLSLVHCFSKDQVNGFYDGPTVAGVTQFQAMNGLHADGVAGPETLRRLNGVIAGSGDTADPKNEEEEAKRLAEAQLTNVALAQSQPESLGWVMPGAPQAAQEAAPAEPVSAIPTFYAADQQPAPPISQLPPLSPADMADIVRAQQQQAPSNDLASMLLAPQTQPAPLPPELSDRALAAQQAQAQPPFQPELAPQPQQLQAAREPRVEPQNQPEPQGLIQKTMRFASAMMQRLSDYFEAKLPSSVLREVQSIGAVMAQNGLREAPIPTGPELARPEQTPARGPEQPQQQVR